MVCAADLSQYFADTVNNVCLLTLCVLLQSQNLYKSAYKVSTDIIAKTQDSGIYKATAPRVYPIISPVADPVLNKIYSTDTYKLVVDQLQPIST